jgi:putative heme-binding domain-containing protein
MFGAATCFACHRFGAQGGAVGPDLTSVRGKFSPRDLLESLLEPSKEISDQYGSSIFTMADGSQVVGRIANLNGDNLQVSTNMMDPHAFTTVNTTKLVKTEESKVSMMPPGLLNMLKDDDILDLLAYLLSGGNAKDPMFTE